MVYLGGADRESDLRALLSHGAKFVLLSYFHIQKRESLVLRLNAEYPGISWMLETGAARHRAAYENDHTVVEMDVYETMFRAFVARTNHVWEGVDSAPFTSTKPALPQEMKCVSPSRGLQEVWAQFRGPFSRFSIREATPAAELARVVAEAARLNKALHLFGHPFAGAESLSVTTSTDRWNSGRKWGEMFVFQNNQLLNLRGGDKRSRKPYSRYFANIGCDPDKILSDDLAEVQKANIMAWSSYANRLAEARRRRGTPRGRLR